MFADTIEIDFGLLGRGMEFYKAQGYTSVNVPWMVRTNISRITLPDEENAFQVSGIDGKYKHLVGSAEQGFLELLADNLVYEDEYYVSCTPCFRRGDIAYAYDDYGQPVGLLNQETFMKVELSMATQNPFNMGWKRVLMADALQFLESLQIQDVRVLEELDGESADIMAFDKSSNQLIELGSYGRRVIQCNDGETLYAHYGTGLALPRLQRIYK
jgi:seryl-tRNA synthetase